MRRDLDPAPRMGWGPARALSANANRGEDNITRQMARQHTPAILPCCELNPQGSHTAVLKQKYKQSGLTAHHWARPKVPGPRSI
jgi:hypothetical protein